MQSIALLASLAGLVLVSSIALAGPATQPSAAPPASAVPDDAGVVVSRMRVLDVPGCSYFYLQTQTTFAQMPSVIESTMKKLEAACKQNHIDADGHAIFVYKGVARDMTKPFHLEIGVRVPEGTNPAGEFQVRQLDPIHCASVIFAGPISKIGNAYMSLFPQIFLQGHEPADEVREMHLYWEGPNSPNNVCVIQVELKE